MYFPIRFYLVAFIIFSLAAHLLLQRQFHPGPSAFNDILAALIKLVKTVIVPLLVIGFSSVALPFLLFWWAYRSRKLVVHIESPGTQPEGLQQELRFSVYPLWQPLLGQVYFRLLYDKGQKRSPKFMLVRKENFIGYAGNRQQGWYRWPLPGIREYEIDSMVIYLEDFFHFFKLAMPVKVNQSFFTRPSTRANQTLHIDPSKSEQDDIRINDWRKVKGEMLQYKHFESNDDVRRIVWKIYARNKELVVRTPEILNPYASHISFYISFFDSLDSEGSHTIWNSCLNFYKAACWTFYRQLEKQGLKIQFTADQPIPVQQQGGEGMEVEYALSVSKWQNTLRPEEYVKLNDASLICISSLNSPDDIKHLVENGSPTLTIALVPLSEANLFPKGWQLLKWLWIETEKDPAHQDNLFWFFSPYRKTLLENEKRIIAILENSGVKYIRFGASPA